MTTAEGTAKGSKIASSPSILEAIQEQLLKLEQDEDITSANDFYMAQLWERRNTVLGWSMTLLAGGIAAVGAFTATSPNNDMIRAATTVLGAVASGLGAVLTNLKPAEISASYREYGNKRKELRNRVRIFRTVDMHLAADIGDLRKELQAFLDLKSALNADNPPIPAHAFKSSRRMLDQRRGVPK